MSAMRCIPSADLGCGQAVSTRTTEAMPNVGLHLSRSFELKYPRLMRCRFDMM
jgi:hypothetical protein